jgi:hypothetical protein
MCGATESSSVVNFDDVPESDASAFSEAHASKLSTQTWPPETPSGRELTFVFQLLPRFLAPAISRSFKPAPLPPSLAAEDISRLTSLIIKYYSFESSPYLQPSFDFTELPH